MVQYKVFELKNTVFDETNLHTVIQYTYRMYARDQSWGKNVFTRYFQIGKKRRKVSKLNFPYNTPRCSPINFSNGSENFSAQFIEKNPSSFSISSRQLQNNLLDYCIELLLTFV